MSDFVGKEKNRRDRDLINIELYSWHARWTLVEQKVYCVACHESQESNYAAQAFVHASGCALQTPVFQYPWHELRAALRYLPKVKL